MDNHSNTRPTRPWAIWMVNAGLLLVMIGTAMPLLAPGNTAFRWVYTAGAALGIIGQIFTPQPSADAPLRLRRLRRIEAFSAIFFCFGAFFMFYHKMGVGPTDWIAFTLAGAALRVYTSLMIPRAARSEK